MPWGFEASMANAYRMCYVYHEGRKMKMTWTHYEFNKLTGCAWISPETNWSTRNRNKNILQGMYKKGGSYLAKNADLLSKIHCAQRK
eukprot:2722183-Ditylum_brightwellii.AAC.1